MLNALLTNAKRVGRVASSVSSATLNGARVVARHGVVTKGLAEAGELGSRVTSHMRSVAKHEVTKNLAYGLAAGAVTAVACAGTVKMAVAIAPVALTLAVVSGAVLVVGSVSNAAPSALEV